MEEKEAIARVREGDLNGLEVLIHRYYLRAVRAAYLIVLDQSQAEDIVQSCFIQAIEKIEQFDDRREFGPWFSRSVVNRALNAVQEQKRFVSIEEEIREDDLLVLKWLPSTEPGPEEGVIQAELQQTVWEAINKLTPKQRAVVVMRYFLELNEAEITEELDSPLSSIKWWLHSARKKLRGFLHQFRTYDNHPTEKQISADQKEE
jgi:RNA polymerase sigma-70 factor (ECF subfamily)